MHIFQISIILSSSLLLHGAHAGRYDRRLVPRQESTFELSFFANTAPVLSKRTGEKVMKVPNDSHFPVCSSCGNDPDPCKRCKEMFNDYTILGEKKTSQTPSHQPPPPHAPAHSGASVTAISVRSFQSFSYKVVLDTTLIDGHKRNKEVPGQDGIPVSSKNPRVGRCDGVNDLWRPCDIHRQREGVCARKRHVHQLTFYELNFVNTAIVKAEPGGPPMFTICEAWIPERKRRCENAPEATGDRCVHHPGRPVWHQDERWREYVIAKLKSIDSGDASDLQAYFVEHPLVAKA